MIEKEFMWTVHHVRIPKQPVMNSGRVRVLSILCVAVRFRNESPYGRIQTLRFAFKLRQSQKVTDATPQQCRMHGFAQIIIAAGGETCCDCIVVRLHREKNNGKRSSSRYL